jgi:cell division protein FtsB
MGMALTGSLTHWLPTLLVIVVNAVALTEATSPPTTSGRRQVWMAGILAAGAVAIAATVWQGRETVDRVAKANEAIRTVARLSSDDDDQIKQLTDRAKSLEEQVARLKEHTPARVFGAAETQKLTDYLQKFGGRSVVVSCIPNDLEAYAYANQLVSILKAAKWQAEGPELTRIFGDVHSVGINLYSGPRAPDTAQILAGALTAAGIPYQPRLAPAEAMPASDAVELFVGALPSAMAATETGSDAHP